MGGGGRLHILAQLQINGMMNELFKPQTWKEEGGVHALYGSTDVFEIVEMSSFVASESPVFLLVVASL